jgi:pimeloyl-ACP methyl ester carboxylesterase
MSADFITCDNLVKIYKIADLYGRGYSDRPAVLYDLDTYVRQLDDLLEHVEKEGRVHLVGLSMGAPIAAAFANRHPDRVMSLVLVDPLIAPVKTGDIFPMNLPLVGEFVARVVMIPHVLPRSQANDFYQPEKFPDWELRYRDQMQYKGFRRAILASIRSLVDVQPMAEYQAVSDYAIPTLLFWGKEDQTTPYADIQGFLEVIPGVEFHVIGDAGHLPHYERPEVVNPLLVKFFRVHSPQVCSYAPDRSAYCDRIP